jgi:hypothetical protein
MKAQEALPEEFGLSRALPLGYFPGDQKFISMYYLQVSIDK